MTVIKYLKPLAQSQIKWVVSRKGYWHFMASFQSIVHKSKDSLLASDVKCKYMYIHRTHFLSDQGLDGCEWTRQEVKNKEERIRYGPKWWYTHVDRLKKCHRGLSICQQLQLEEPKLVTFADQVNTICLQVHSHLSAFLLDIGR